MHLSKLASLLSSGAICPQPEKLVPMNSSDYFFTDSYRSHSANLLGGAVQIHTETFDDMNMDPLKDTRFNNFYELHDYLRSSFPLATKHGNIEMINTFGMLYTFKGSEDLKPILFTAHLDTVPVDPDTLDRWEFGPFSGHYDGEWLYGRGAADCKNNVVGLLETVEYLLQSGWTPKRTILLGFGFDEEVGGDRGAATIAKTLIERYGPDSLEFILDEGAGQLEIEGVQVIGPYVTERGALNTKITVYTPGGHSSLPPVHTGIGIMGKIVSLLEDNPYVPSIKNWTTHPGAQLYRCIAENSRAFSTKVTEQILNLDKKGNLKSLVDIISKRTSWMVWTSQACDVIRGGVKVNALPEKVELATNYRISVDSSPEEVYKHVESLLGQIASKYDFGLQSEKEVLAQGSKGTIVLEAVSKSPVSPVTAWTGRQWDVLTGTMRHIFENVIEVNAPIVVAPAIVSGNTDTNHYWDLSKFIYRYSPVLLKDALNKHAADEKLRLRAHLGSVAFYYEAILNYDCAQTDGSLMSQ